jgi:hypothetical protein
MASLRNNAGKDQAVSGFQTKNQQLGKTPVTTDLQTPKHIFDLNLTCPKKSPSSVSEWFMFGTTHLLVFVVRFGVACLSPSFCKNPKTSHQ